MKLLQINASYKPAFIYGGPTQSVSRLCEEMVLAGCRVHVLSTTANGRGELPVVPGKTVQVDGVDVTYFRRLTKDHSHYSPAMLRHLRRHVREFDVVHIHAWWNLVSVLACRIALSQGVPVIISPRGTLSRYSFGSRNSLGKRILHEWWGKDLLAKSRFHVTAPNEEMTVRALIPAPKIYNIPNFVNFPVQLPRAAPSADGPLKLLFFSRIEAKKGLDILFEALAGIGIPYRLTIAGDGEAGYVNQLKQLAAEKGISEHLTWAGFQGDHKFELLSGHELLVLPSHDENFGNVVIESLSVGTPVLISDGVGLAGYIGATQLGWVRQRSADAFREELQSVYQERSRLADIRKLAPGIIRRDFDAGMLAKQYINMYQDIIHGGI